MVSGTGVNSTIRRNSSNISSGNYSASLGGLSNSATTNYSTVVGGYKNIISGGTHSFIGGGYKNTASGYYSFIGGGYCNVVSGYYGRSIVVGGKYNTSSGRDSFIGGGQSNCAGYISSSVVGGELNCSLCRGSFVGGGTNNTVSGGCSSIVAGQSNVLSAPWSFIGGGYRNNVSGCNSTIGGGCCNTASGCTSFIGGGSCNTASGSTSTIAGGCCNTSSGPISTIGGGCCNIASNCFSTIGGGQGNTASGCFSFVGGGFCNTSSGNYSFVGGGYKNTASGCFSSIIGGQSNNDGGFNNIHIIGSNITGTTSGTTFVNNLRSLGSVSATTISATTYYNVSTNFQYEIHVSQIDGNDTTGDGSLLNPVATITKALTLLTGSRKTIIVHPGGYNENVTVANGNTTIATSELTGANTLLYGTLTIGTLGSGSRISGLKMTNLVISGTAQAYISNCTVDTQVTKSSSGYVEIINTEMQCISGIQISGSGTIIINGNKNVGISVSNASAQVIVKGCNSVVTPSASAGNLAIVDCIVTALGGNAITITNSATTLTLINSQVLVQAGDNVAPISVAGIYSIFNTIYDKPNSTLSGTSTNSIDYFQYINADKFITQGGTSLQYVMGDGSLSSGFTGGTVTGATIFTSGLTANTISATTYQNLNNQISLSGLSGVSITSVSNGDMLVYSGLSWMNKTQEFISRQNQRVVYTDFMNSSTSAGVQFPYTITLVNTGAVNSSILTNGVNPGINRFRSSATPNSGVYLLPIGTVIGTGTYYYQPNTQVDYIFRTPATIVGTGIIVRFGMVQTASSTVDFDYGTYIEINENSLYGKTADNSVRSQTSTTYTLSTDTWYHGRVKYVSSSLIEYSLYNMGGTLLWSDTLTTNIPSSTRINPIILTLSSGSTAIDLIINDYFSTTYPVSNRGALN
jgi:hypothetical protein